MRIWHVILIVVVILAAIWIVGGFDKPTAKASDISVPTAQPKAPPVEKPVVEASVAEITTADVPSDGVLDGLNPITETSGYELYTTVSRSGAFEPVWPEGTDQISVGYANPEEYPDGRTFMTRNPTTKDEVLAFVAQCVSINDGEKICHDEKHGALVGLLVGGPDGEWPITIWDAELKTLIIPGGIEAGQAYIFELSTFISSNKDGRPVEILGPSNTK